MLIIAHELQEQLQQMQRQREILLLQQQQPTLGQLHPMFAPPMTYMPVLGLVHPLPAMHYSDGQPLQFACCCSDAATIAAYRSLIKADVNAQHVSSAMIHVMGVVIPS